jgi:hypothetical protein
MDGGRRPSEHTLLGIGAGIVLRMRERLTDFAHTLRLAIESNSLLHSVPLV